MIELTQFREYMELQDLSQGTIEDYLFEMKKVPEYLEDQRKYLVTNRGKRMLISAYRKYLRFQKSIGKINAEQLLDLLDTFKLPKKRGKTKKATWYPQEDWGNVLLSLPNRCAKMAAYIQLQFGLRVGEVSHLRAKEDIDFENMYVHIQARPGWHPKHKRDRSVPMLKNQANIFQRWIKTIPAEITNGYLLWSNRVKERVKERSIQRWYHKANIRSHDLRRSFAKVLYYNSDKNVKLVSDLLGHANIATTSVYLGLESEEVREGYEKAMS